MSAGGIRSSRDIGSIARVGSAWLGSRKPEREAGPRSVPGCEATGDSQSAVLRGKSVVIVEDEGITQMQLKLILKRAGLMVAGSAMTGEDGVALALLKRPELVLMDIKMPGDIDGLEAARRILAAYSTCVVMLTAYTEHQEQAWEIGAAGYVVKPIDGPRLVPRLEEAWRAHRGQ